MSMQLQRVLQDYAQHVDTLRQTVRLLESQKGLDEEQIEKLTDIMTDNENNDIIFNFCTEEIGNRVKAINDADLSIEEFNGHIKTYVSAQLLLVEVVQKNCDHKMSFIGTRDDSDYFKCVYCGKEEDEYYIPELKI